MLMQRETTQPFKQHNNPLFILTRVGAGLCYVCPDPAKESHSPLFLFISHTNFLQSTNFPMQLINTVLTPNTNLQPAPGKYTHKSQCDLYCWIKKKKDTLFYVPLCLRTTYKILSIFKKNLVLIILCIYSF